MMKSFLVLAACFAAAAFASEADVLVLTSSNFDEIIAAHEHVLVEFYAPWCGHCKKLAPEYALAATDLKGKVALGKVDATEEKTLGSKFGVKGYPTLKWFVGGKPQEYGGGRDRKAIVSWCKKKSGPVLSSIADDDSHAKFTTVKGDNVAIVGYFEADSDAFRALNKVAVGDDDNAYGVVTDAAVAEAAGHDFPSIVVHRTFDGGNQATTDFGAVAEFVAGNSLPLVNTFSNDKAPKLFAPTTPHKVIMFADDEELKSSMETAAASKKGQAVFIMADSSEERLHKFFGLKPADFPSVQVIYLDGESAPMRYPLKADLSTVSREDLGTAIGDHLQDVLDGKVDPDLKSQDPAEIDEFDGGVRQVTGSNFWDIAGKSSGVFLEVYAPWCGHCKKLIPVWEKLAAEFSGGDVIIAKCDGTENEIKGIDWKGFPTLKWVPAGSSEVEDYSGGRDEDALISFVSGKLGGSDKSEL